MSWIGAATVLFNAFPFLYSGTKNYLGFNKTSVGNYFVYADAAPIAQLRRPLASPGGPSLGQGWNACVMSYGTHALPANLTDVWSQNTCLTANAAFFAFNDCDASAPLGGSIPLFSGNTWATDAGTWEMACGKTKWTLAEAQALGVDVGSSVVPMPSTAEIIAAGRALLEM